MWRFTLFMLITLLPFHATLHAGNKLLVFFESHTLPYLPPYLSLKAILSATTSGYAVPTVCLHLNATGQRDPKFNPVGTVFPTLLSEAGWVSNGDLVWQLASVRHGLHCPGFQGSVTAGSTCKFGECSCSSQWLAIRCSIFIYKNYH